MKEYWKNAYNYWLFDSSYWCLRLKLAGRFLAYMHHVRISSILPLILKDCEQRWMMPSIEIQDARFILFGTC